MKFLRAILFTPGDPVCMALFALFAALAGWPLMAAADGTLCAEVKIEIRQELSLERQAFEAHMRIHNGAPYPLTNIEVEVNFTDKDGNPVTATSHPYHENDEHPALFFIRPTEAHEATLDTDTATDLYWLIIPNPGASNGSPQGTVYYVGATLRYQEGGTGKKRDITVAPDYILVKPMPELRLDYFLPSEVYGDDENTPEFDAVPFSLGLRVTNFGQGTARRLAIASAQPKITENEMGLLVNFLITGSEVNGQPATPSMLVDFGDLPSLNIGMARWIMTSSLSGDFSDFQTSLYHSDELGGEVTALIKEEHTHPHYLLRDILVDLPGRDTIRDVLSTDNAQEQWENAAVFLYESEYLGESIEPAEPQQGDEVTNISSIAEWTASGNKAALVPNAVGNLYFHKAISQTVGEGSVQAVRSDGKVLRTENVWLSKHRQAGTLDQFDYAVNLFDRVPPDLAGISYTLTFSRELAFRTVTASAGSNGSLSPSGAVQVAYGASQRFVITAEEGYVLSSLLQSDQEGNVVNVTAEAVAATEGWTYTMPSVTENLSLEATFQAAGAPAGFLLWTD